MKDIINGLVSERVMGWSRKTLSNNESGLPFFANFWINDLGEKTEPVTGWSPATRLEQAWEVLNYLRSKNILISIKTLTDGFETTFDGKFGAVSKSESIAICIACIKAMGIDISDEYATYY
jgi:hypothetical protein